MRTNQRSDNRFRCVVVVVGLFLATAAWAVDANVQACDDRYRDAYQRYVEAVQSGQPATIVSNLADQLRQAEVDLRDAQGRSATLTPAGPSTDGIAVGANTPVAGMAAQDPVLDAGEAFARSVQGVATAGALTLRTPSDEERRFESLLEKLYAPGREKRTDEAIAALEAFLATAREPRTLWNASSELSDLYASRGNAAGAEKVWQKFAARIPHPEARRLALNRIKEVRAQMKVQAERRDFYARQKTCGQRWERVSTVSWWAAPVKLWRLGEYAASAVSRRLAGGRLLSAVKEYEKIAAESFPRGTLDAETRSRLIPCNDVTLLCNGRTSFARRYELAAQARDSIVLQTLLYHNDEAGNRLADVLIERAQAGVDVRVIVDDAFAGGGRKASILRKMQNGGVKVRINNPMVARPWLANFRSHQKVFVVDNSVAIVGGMNCADEYANGEITEWGWRDTDCEVQGPIVAEIIEMFENNWETVLAKTLWYKFDRAASEPVKDTKEVLPILPKRDQLIRGPLPVYFATPPRFENVRARFVTTYPTKSKDDDILDLMTVYLKNCRHEAILETAYFIPTQGLSDAIADACRRGVKVRVLTNSVESNNHPNAGLAGRARYEEAMKLGTEIYEWRGAQTLHSKVSWFDGFAASLGAYNVNNRSHACDAEDTFAVQDRRFAMAIKSMLDRDLSRAKRVTAADLAAWKSELSTVLKTKFFSLFDRLF